MDAGDTPAPKPKPKSISLVGTLDAEGAWNTDHDLTNTSGDTWVIKNVTLTADDEFKLRADHDWGAAWGGPEANEKSTIDPENPYDVYAPTLGTAFNTGDKNIRVGVAGAYNITFTYGDTPTILIEEYREFPEHLYMTGTDFGNWFGDQSGVVELTPVLHNPDWGANAEAQFWTVRYFKAASGFKFNSAPSWDGNDFNSLETNDGFTVSDGNCFVPSDGFYMVHIDCKRSILHIEPAKVRIVGDCTGLGTDSWNVEMVEAATNNVFVADGTTLKVTLPAGGNLRMYAASAISTSDPWTREFNIYDGKIVYRGTGGDLDNVPALAEQVVTLDFNAGTGSITGEGQAPAYKDVISVPGNWSEWTADAPKLGGDTKGLYKGVLAMYGDAIEFKFIHDGSWIGGTAGDGLTYTLGANDNMTIAAGTYFWTVNLVENTASAVAVTKVGLMGTFNGFLVGQLGLQPIIATLILMVSGRGIAQITTNGKQYTTMYSPFRWIGQGSCLWLPTPIILTIIIVAAVMIFVRKTAFGTFVESVGINRSASRLSGINAKLVIFIVFALTGLLSGISGLIYSSRIMSNDSNNAGINYETDAILSVVIGGTSMSGGKFSMTGTIIGSIIIRTIITFVYYFGVAPESTMAFKALIIAIIIVLQSEPVRNWMAKRAASRSKAKAMMKGGIA